MKMSGNTIFIPGATSGIGLGLASRLQEAGNTVIIGGRRRELLDEVVADNPGIETVLIDITDPESIGDAFVQVTTAHPDLNILITMAGIMIPENLRSPDFLATAESTIETNLLGPIRLCAAFIPFLAEKKSATVMTVSSGLAFVPLPFTPTYSATKAAIHSFTESMRVQLADTTIEVLELVPPAVRTTLMGQQDSEEAMPLDEFLDETMELLAAQHTPGELLVDRVKFLRNAEASGNYNEVLDLLSGH